MWSWNPLRLHSAELTLESRVDIKKLQESSALTDQLQSSLVPIVENPKLTYAVPVDSLPARIRFIFAGLSLR